VERRILSSDPSFDSCTPRSLPPLHAAQELFFSTPGGTTQTVQGWFESCSLGRTTITPSTSRVVSVTLPCSGTWGRQNKTWNADTCDNYAIAAVANAAVVASGISLAKYP
jgi:hypothetical protein